MKKLRCTSCGAELKVDDNKEYAVCEHCGSKYKLNEDVNINIKLDDNIKDVINNGFMFGKKFSKFALIPIGIFVIFIVLIILFSFKSSADFEKRNRENEQEFEEQVNKGKEEGEKYSFNFQFVGDEGTDYGNLVSDTIDDIIKSNKTHDKKVTLVYNGESFTDENKMIEIKHSLGEWDKYEVVINYDDDGYVNEIKIDKI